MSARYVGASNLATQVQQRTIVIDLYCRISKDYDGTLRSVESQEAQGLAWIAERAHLGYVLGEVHKDHALSAWNPKVKRTQFIRLRNRIESGAAQGVWVRDLDRFTRKFGEAAWLHDAAVGGLLVAAGYSTYDFDTADGRSKFMQDATKAVDESNRTSERTRRGKSLRVQAGKTNASHRGFARPGYLPNPQGWAPGDPRTPVPPEQLAAEVRAVQDAVARILAGEHMNVIAREWNQQGLRTVAGNTWDGGVMRQMLGRPAVAGLVTLGKDADGNPVVVGDGQPAPLDRATWDRLMLHFTAKKRGRQASAYLLSGIMRCGLCERPVQGRPVYTRKPYDDGEMARHYWCQLTMKGGGCGRVTIDMRYADEYVAELVVQRLGDPRHADRVARVAARLQEQQRAVKRELDRLNAEADALAGKVGSPGWTVARVDAGLAAFAPLVADAEARLKALGVVPDTAGASTADAGADWEAGDLAQRRAMVQRAFPEGLYLLPSATRGSGRQAPERFRAGPAL